MGRRAGWLVLSGVAGALVAVVPLLVGSVTGPEVDPSRAPWAGSAPLPAAAVQTFAGHDPDALALLNQAVRAAQHRSYAVDQQITVHRAGGDVSSRVHVVHRAGQGTTRTVHSGAGAQRSAPAVMFHPDRDAATPAASGVLSQLVRSYRVRPGQPVHVGVIPAREVLAVRADGSLAARLAVADDTSLVVRREVLDARGQPLRTVVFSNLSLIQQAAVTPPDHETPPDHDTPQGRAAPLTTAEVAALRAHGCVCPERLPGGLRLFDTRHQVAGGSKLLHLTYSDGLSTLSLFSQPGRLDADAMADVSPQRVQGTTVWVHQAEPLRVTWQADDQVVTVVSDAPAEVVREVIAGLPRQRTADPDSPRSRWLRGVTAMVEAGNPL